MFPAYIASGNMHLVAEETAGNVDLLAPNDDNLLAAKDLLRDNRSKAAQKMALAVNDNGGGGEGGHVESGLRGKGTREISVNGCVLSRETGEHT